MQKIWIYLQRYALYIAFIQAWAATLGSILFYEILKYPPCLLCWYQRILMWPLAIILGVAILRRDRNVGYYVLPISAAGALLAFYHYLIQMTPLDEITPVSCSEYGACSDIQVQFLGFVTIPFLSMSAFVVISAMMLILLKSKRSFSANRR